MRPPMDMNATLRSGAFFASLTVVALAAASITLTACSSGDVPVGSTDQALQSKKDGGATGNGNTCSWDDTVSYDVATGTTTTTPAPNGQYTLGQKFMAGCNECTCTAQGIACTTQECAPPKACTEEAKQCPDGSYVARTGPSCEFAPCPGDVACTEDAKQCPDGSYVGRSGPACEFAPCPTAQVCDQSAKQCPDGSYVGRTGPNCAFAPCP
jgi:hypothetical protein